MPKLPFTFYLLNVWALPVSGQKKPKNFEITGKNLLDEWWKPCYNTYLCGMGVFCAHIGKER